MGACIHLHMYENHLLTYNDLFTSGVFVFPSTTAPSASSLVTKGWESGAMASRKAWHLVSVFLCD